MTGEIHISPSILAADPLHLGDAVAAVRDAGVTRLQVDVMDGRFVPNITYGPAVVKAIKEASGLMVEAHLMIVEPERYVPVFAEAGADVIIVHQEVSPHLYRTLQHIRDQGKRSGVAINPGTPAFMLDDVLGLADLVLVMTVNPGFGGQQFIPEMLAKVRTVRDMVDRRGLAAELEVDGGIDEETAPEVTAAGATVLVAGTAVYDNPSGVSAAVTSLRRAALSGTNV
ncbi:MAG TPA: ribulose-phosphate 3-epimerase [Chloroflexota bacterium]|nr:ribulose-phosphate 3-epimerase [Chloroflexota bacterium]